MRPARRLRWELARSYALVTTAATLLTGVVAVAAAAVVAPRLEFEIGGAGLVLTGLLGAGLVAAFALAVGSGFGYLTARGLTRRLERLAAAAEAWSGGDFGVAVGDPAVDELGDLGRRLDRMAGQLRDLVWTRQALAAAEERDRLARDLHDAVKQQLFALSLQLAAARAQLDKADPAAARLAEAERLAAAAQEELGAIIRAVRPAPLDGTGLAGALRTYVAGWSARTGIEAEIRTEDDRGLPPPVADALYRVAQEALANAERHSGAGTVRVTLGTAGARAMLTIADDGRGFDGARNGAGLGLRGMEERMAALGGRLRLQSRSDGGGTRVEAWGPETESANGAAASQPRGEDEGRR